MKLCTFTIIRSQSLHVISPAKPMSFYVAFSVDMRRWTKTNSEQVGFQLQSAFNCIHFAVGSKMLYSILNSS